MLKGAKRNYDFKKFNDKTFQIFLDSFRPLINDLNREIQDGIKNSKEIRESRNYLLPLKESTTRIRRQRNQSTGPPLIITGELKKTRIWRPTPADPTFAITMEGHNEGNYYGALHNRGFRTDPKSMIPNKKVPARNWFGIPKPFKKGGTRYEEAMRQARFLLRRALRTRLKKIK